MQILEPFGSGIRLDVSSANTTGRNVPSVPEEVFFLKGAGIEAMHLVAHDEGWDQADVRELFDQAVAFEPEYYKP